MGSTPIWGLYCDYCGKVRPADKVAKWTTFVNGMYVCLCEECRGKLDKQMAKELDLITRLLGSNK